MLTLDLRWTSSLKESEAMSFWCVFFRCLDILSEGGSFFNNRFKTVDGKVIVEDELFDLLAQCLIMSL